MPKPAKTSKITAGLSFCEKEISGLKRIMYVRSNVEAQDNDQASLCAGMQT